MAGVNLSQRATRINKLATVLYDGQTKMSASIGI
jgi:hypothetical protein